MRNRQLRLKAKGQAGQRSANIMTNMVSPGQPKSQSASLSSAFLLHNSNSAACYLLNKSDSDSAMIEEEIK